MTEDRYRTLFETLPQGVIYCAADGLIIEANPAASEILGVDADAMISWPRRRVASRARGRLALAPGGVSGDGGAADG